MVECQLLVVFLVIGRLVGLAGAGAGLYTGPYFPTPQPRNITVHQNTQAYLPCTVKQLGDKSVSWVRQRDADILTVDRYTFVRDDRFTVHYSSDTHTWTLVIKYVQERDAGTYECQISTEPKMSMFVDLNVIVPQVEVTGDDDKYVFRGSTARLECKVSSTVQLPDYIFWYHSGARLLEYHHPRLKIMVSRRGGQGSEMSVTSTLIISDARTSDAGNYTCLPSNLHSATTVLHVINEEHPAAMQTGAAMLTDPPSPWGILLVVLIAFVFVHAHPGLPHAREGDLVHLPAAAHHLPSGASEGEETTALPSGAPSSISRGIVSRKMLSLSSRSHHDALVSSCRPLPPTNSSLSVSTYPLHHPRQSHHPNHPPPKEDQAPLHPHHHNPPQSPFASAILSPAKLHLASLLESTKYEDGKEARSSGVLLLHMTSSSLKKQQLLLLR